MTTPTLPPELEKEWNDFFNHAHINQFDRNRAFVWWSKALATALEEQREKITSEAEDLMSRNYQEIIIPKLLADERQKVLSEFAEFCHEHYLGCSQNSLSKTDFEYAYDNEVVCLIEPFLAKLNQLKGTE